MKTQQTAGVLQSLNIHTCSACGEKVVWARDDRYPEKRDVGALVNVEPNPLSTHEGTIVLWYQVTEKGKTVGEQWFRLIEPTSDYAGDRWSNHYETCGKIMKVDDAHGG